MTKTSALAALLALAPCAGAAPLEALRVGAEARFLQASLEAVPPPSAPEGAPVEGEGEDEAYPMPERLPQEPVITHPTLITPPAGQTLGRLLGQFTLAERLDTHRDLMPLQLGAGLWNVSVAGDAKFESAYLSFQQGERLQLHRIKDLNELRGDGVVVRLDERTAYRFKVDINIFSPVRGSTLKVDPVQGTQGPRHSRKTGEVLDAVKRESFVFKASGKEYWVLYGTDVDPATDQLAQTRSLLFINEAGTSSKAWPVAEASLEPGKPLTVALGDAQVTLLRTAEGALRIHDGGGTGASGPGSAR